MAGSLSAVERTAVALVVHKARQGAYRTYFDSVHLRGDERILDVGCGSGAGSRCLAERLGSGGSLTCLEVSEEWLKIARRRLSRFNNVEFVVGDAARMKLPESAYDVAVLHFALHQIDRCSHGCVMRNVTRALKAGGRLYVRERRDELDSVMATRIRALAADAGLRFEQAAGGRAAWIGPTTELVFARP